MTTKHTPGPWKQGERGWILDASGHMVTKEAVIQCAEERDRLRAVNAELVKALEIAEATIQRLQRHAPGTANGTLDVMRAALAKAKEKS